MAADVVSGNTVCFKLFMLFHCEHSDNPANIHNVCHSPLCSAIDPPTSNVSLFVSDGDDTTWLDTYCCLPDVSVSEPEEEEKSLLQCKTLWMYICTLHCDYFNRGTYFQPAMGL